MKVYSVVLFPTAQSDFEDIFKFIELFDPEGAEQSFEQFFARIDTLTTSPESYAYAKDPQLRLRGYRVLPVENHFALFVINEDKVEIHRILFARRHYEHFL